MNELIILTEIHNLEAGIIIIIFLLGYNVRMNKKSCYMDLVLFCHARSWWRGGMVEW